MPTGFSAPGLGVAQPKRSESGAGRASVTNPSGSGRQMPDIVRSKMESSFGHDFSAVRVHEGREAPSIGALAYTRCSNIHFAPGRYQPATGSGQQLLGHELTHVVQQRAGRVKAPAGAAVPINADPGLEREADRMGARAASGALQAKDAPKKKTPKKP